MEEIDKIIIKLSYKAKKEAIKELIGEYKDNPKIVKKLKKCMINAPLIFKMKYTKIQKCYVCNEKTNYCYICSWGLTFLLGLNQFLFPILI